MELIDVASSHQCQVVRPRSSDFFIQYIDPESRTVRSNYSDFLLLRSESDGSERYVIVEVKADNQIDDAVVQVKKDFASQIAERPCGARHDPERPRRKSGRVTTVSYKLVEWCEFPAPSSVVENGSSPEAHL